MADGSIFDQQIMSVLKVDNKGWNPEIFTNTNNTLLCENCHLICCDAVELSCDHNDDDICSFCNVCLNRLIKDNNDKCPINSHENAIISPIRSLRRQIYKSLVICPYSVQYKQKINNEDIINDQKEGEIMNNVINRCNFQGTFKELIENHIVICIQKYNPLFKYINTINKLKNENKKLNQ
eukprot:185333_1